jgi:Transposase DDE domain
VTCPAGVTAPIRPSGHKRHAGAARFGASCRACPLAGQCTTARQGRTITIGPHEARLAAARIRQADPAWKADYTATRPKVERKIGHLMRRRHGGRRARVRGQLKGERIAVLHARLDALNPQGLFGARWDIRDGAR